jgi:hypothetical protein
LKEEAKERYRQWQRQEEKRLPSKVSLPRSNVNPYLVPLDVASIRRKTGEDVMGWIAACVLVALLLPIMGFLYLDILEAKHETKAQIEKVEKLRREIEREKRDKKPDSFSDNPVFDRVRRPLSLSLPRSKKLGKTECEPPACEASGSCTKDVVPKELYDKFKKNS